MQKDKGLVMAGSIGSCVHVAGAVHFLDLAAEEGYSVLFLGPACSIDRVIELAAEKKPAMISLGYRLTPENLAPLLRELTEKSRTLSFRPVWVFGGTRPTAAEAEKWHFFDAVFDGSEDIDDSISFLRTGRLRRRGEAVPGEQDLVGRILGKRPYPLLRHHFGLPSFAETEKGIAEIAGSGVLDVISLGPDQNTQQFFFAPGQRDPRMDGAGGVPVRSEEEFARLKAASQCGNMPLMRCYSGTADVFRYAAMLRGTIGNAWAAVPLCWYNEMDGRGSRRLLQSVSEAQELIAWHGSRDIPVEVNEPHHWGLRDAHDTISVATSFLSAYNARKYGVKEYVSQYMFNIPASMSFAMDLAKVEAQIAMTESLASPNFRVWREVRAGLPFLSGDLDIAKGQLAASTYNAMSVRPDIIHVVGYSEAEHAATPDVVIESCRIVRGVVRSVLRGAPDASADPAVCQRRRDLIAEATVLLSFIRSEYAAASPDPWGDAAVIADCIHRGILDAPHIAKNAEYRGTLHTRMIGGCCLAVDAETGSPLSEEERLAGILEKEKKEGKEHGQKQNRSDQHRERRAVNGGVLR